MTTWLIELLHWICLCEILESNIWGLVATRITEGALIWINARFHIAQGIKVIALPSWNNFNTILKDWFEPLVYFKATQGKVLYIVK